MVGGWSIVGVTVVWMCGVMSLQMIDFEKGVSSCPFMTLGDLWRASCWSHTGLDLVIEV